MKALSVDKEGPCRRPPGREPRGPHRVAAQRGAVPEARGSTSGGWTYSHVRAWQIGRRSEQFSPQWGSRGRERQAGLLQPRPADRGYPQKWEGSPPNFKGDRQIPSADPGASCKLGRGWPVTSRVSRRGSCPFATLRPGPASPLTSLIITIGETREAVCPGGLGPLRQGPASPTARTGAVAAVSVVGCTRLHRKPRPRPADARRPPPGRAALCPAGAGYQRHLSAQGQPLRTHSRPDTPRLYTETGFARLTPAAPANAHRTHTALIREAAAPPPRHHSRFVPAEGA